MFDDGSLPASRSSCIGRRAGGWSAPPRTTMRDPVRTAVWRILARGAHRSPKSVQVSDRIVEAAAGLEVETGAELR